MLKHDELAKELFDAVLNNNTHKICSLSADNKDLLNFTYPEEGKSILLIACSKEGVNAKTVSTLLDLGANPGDFTEGEGWEALHWAANNTNYDILNILLERNPEIINAVDKYDNNALHILIRYGNTKSPVFQKCIELLTEKGINADQKNSKNKTPIDWAVKKKLRADIIEIMKMKISNSNNVEVHDGRILLEYLKEENIDHFINFKDGNIKDIVDHTEESHTLLQFCCEKNLTRAAIYLLDKGADHELTSRKNNSKPVVLAAEMGNKEIFKALLDKYEILNIPKEVLPLVVKYIDREYHDNIGCYTIFIEKIKEIKETHPDEVAFKLNEGDNDGNTALHYAVLYAEPHVIEELLSLGASLGTKNNNCTMPIKNIDREILRKHLDKCVMFDLKEKKSRREDFKITFNYRTLIPPYIRLNKKVNLKADTEAPNTQLAVQKKLVAETEVIYFMGKTSGLKDLLEHPTITSFLYLKWLQTHRVFWVNLVSYLLLAISLLIPYIISTYDIHHRNVRVLREIFIIGCFALILRVIFKILVAPIGYFSNIKNYIEISLTVLVAVIAFGALHLNKPRNELSAVAILLVAFELFLILGQHPNLSTYVAIMGTVSSNFYKFLIWYSLPIIAFSVSFYLLFATNDNINSTDTNSSNNTDYDQSFNHPVKSVFKTIIMLTGEFDSSSINFDTYPVTSKLVFAAFIFTVAIILVNLLNGLAVSDIQMIKNDAESVGYIARTQFITNIESILTGNIFIVKLIQKLIDASFPSTTPREWNYRVGQCLARIACLCPNMNYEMTFYPLKDGLIDSTNLNSISLCKRYLDRETILKTNNIIQKHDDEVKRSRNNRIERIENKIDNILEFIGTMNEVK